MKKLIIILLMAYLPCYAQLTPFEQSDTKNVSATHPQAIAFYQALDVQFEELKLLTCGLTDSGKPLHLAVLSKNKNFDPVALRKQNKRIVLINNGIHPGEPEGIDATMLLARDLLKNHSLPADVVICVIPLYNIDGSLNRSSTSRANQNGPGAYGFRGNAQNLDLNRDFIKTDSKNSKSFQEIFNTWQPDIFFDNHTSNGADYQYVMTLIDTQQDKLSPILANFMTKQLTPELFKRMKASGFEMTPYVDHVGETPDLGIQAFLEPPRFSTGYAALHQTMGYIPETHMLKPFAQRVQATYELMKHLLAFTQEHAAEIGTVRVKALAQAAKQTQFPLNWKLDEKRVDSLRFKGFEASYKPSEISGQNRLYYDRAKPYEKTIPWFNHYEATLTVQAPKAYIIPQAWHKVIDLLKLNGVKLERLKKDSVLNLEMYTIVDYKTGSKPYEGHYLHSQVTVKAQEHMVQFYAGDYVVRVNQPQNRYIVETLEPQGVDSFFAWNFFDSILNLVEWLL